jgi:hypothetical protein
VLRHDYHDIVDEVIWRIVEDDLARRPRGVLRGCGKRPRYH